MKEDVGTQGFNQNDFLTVEQMKKIPPTMPPGVMISEEESPFDLDLHKEEQFISKERKAQIDEEISKFIGKEQLAQERVEKAVNETKKKYEEAPKHPRDILNDLLTRGELRKTYECFNHNWTLRALDQGDILLAMDDLKDSIESDAGRMTALVFSKVVYSIEAIDDIPIYQFFPEITPQNHPSKIDYIIAIKRALRAYLVGMPPSVIDELYYKYVELEKERDEAISKLKNS